MPPQLPGSAAPGPGRPLATYASVAHVARVYDYLLGGKDNLPRTARPPSRPCGST